MDYERDLNEVLHWYFDLSLKDKITKIKQIDKEFNEKMDKVCEKYENDKGVVSEANYLKKAKKIFDWYQIHLLQCREIDRLESERTGIKYKLDGIGNFLEKTVTFERSRRIANLKVEYNKTTKGRDFKLAAKSYARIIEERKEIIDKYFGEDFYKE